MIRRQYIDNKIGGQIHLAEIGQGPAVLLIHQTPRSWDEYREVMELLASDFHLIAMDLPGMGASTLTGQKPTIESYAHAAALVIENLENVPVTVCGHHTGGVVAIELSASQPELVSSLVLSSTPWIDEKARLERVKKVPIDTIESTREGDHLTDLWQQRAPYYPDNAEYMNRFIATALMTTDPAAGHHAVSQYHMEKSFSKIDCPVLLVEHMKDPFAIKHTANLKAAFPHASQECIPNGQIALEVSAPQFAEILNRWMRNEREPSGDKTKGD